MLVHRVRPLAIRHHLRRLSLKLSARLRLVNRLLIEGDHVRRIVGLPQLVFPVYLLLHEDLVKLTSSLLDDIFCIESWLLVL